MKHANTQLLPSQLLIVPYWTCHLFRQRSIAAQTSEAGRNSVFNTMNGGAWIAAWEIVNLRSDPVQMVVETEPGLCVYPPR